MTVFVQLRQPFLNEINFSSSFNLFSFKFLLNFVITPTGHHKKRCSGKKIILNSLIKI